MPAYRCIVLPWIKPIGQKVFLPTWLAITIGPFIISWQKLNEIELAHELEHVRQWRKNGLMYIPRYLASSSAAAKAGKDRYLDNEFEVEARAAAAKVEKQLAGHD